MGLISVQRERGLAVVTIQRPERRNALHGPLWTELAEVAQALTAEPARVVILTGAGGHFSAGMDLKPDNPLIARLMPAIMGQDEAVLRALIVELKAVVAAVAAIPCPVIAAIDGACAGGGLEVALACDLRVASAEAFFSLPEARLGMMPDVGGTVRLIRAIGSARALDLALSGGKIDARTALSYGLVNRLAEQGPALPAARAFAEELLTASPTATREVLTLCRATAPTLEEETAAGVRVLKSGEVAEGVAAFLERRLPSWSS